MDLALVNCLKRFFVNVGVDAQDMVSRVDQIYRSILLTKFFVRGWGKPENLRQLFAFRKIISNRETCQDLVDKSHPVTITKEADHGDHILLDAEFVSPFVDHLPGLLPKESEKAVFQMIVPKRWRTPLKPTCLHLAGTGDHGFWRRKMLMGKPLLDESGIASIIHENPFYGCRKPRHQIRSSLHNVSDLFVMGGCLVLESLAIFHWCERMGFGPLGITGISMGGHMASLAATNWPKPLPLIPCLSWSTASGVFTQMASAAATSWHKPLAIIPCLSWTTTSQCFTQGVMSGAINWQMLKNQYFSNDIFREELFNMIQSPEGHFPVYHEVGQKFARDFPKSMSHVEQIMVDQKREQEAVHKSHHSYSSCDRRELSDQNGNNCDTRTAEKGESCQPYTESVHSVSSSGGGSLGLSVSLPRLNIINTLGFAKSKITKTQHTQESRKSSKARNILIGYKTAKSKVSKPVHEFTPVGIRPRQATNTKTVKFDPYMEVKDSLTWEAVQFMRGIMDECTHLGNFSVPVDPSLVIIVAAKNDGYMPRDGIIPLTELWPGSEMRTIESGHVAAYLFNHQVFRQAIKDAFDRVTAKYHTSLLH